MGKNGRMGIGETIFSGIFNILNIYTNFRFINIFLKKKDVNPVLARIIYFLVWLTNWIICYMYQNGVATLISLITLLILATVVLFQGSLFRKVLAVCSMAAIGVVVEIIIWSIFLQYKVFRENASSIGTLLTAVVLMIVVLVLERFFKVDKAQYISPASYVNVIIVLIGNIALAQIVYDLLGAGNVKTLIMLCIIGVIDISTFYLYNKVNEVYHQKLEKSMMEEQIEMYENQFKIMSESQNNLRALRHDMKNHFQLVKAYINEDKFEEAKSYIEALEDYGKVTGQYVDTGNQEVDTILNYTLERAAKLSCKIETKIAVPEESFIPGFDLNVLLGNLLENAIEALEKTEERYLYVGMNYKRGVLLVRIWNSYDGRLKKNGETYITRKKDKENHGIGLKNIHEVIEKYNGEQMIDTTDKLFKTDVILYLKKDDGID